MFVFFENSIRSYRMIPIVDQYVILEVLIQQTNESYYPVSVTILDMIRSTPFSRTPYLLL